MSKKVLLITYYWPPSGGAGVQRTLKFVKFLPEFGIESIVLTIDEKVAAYPFIDHSLLKDISPDLKVVKTQDLELLGKFKKLFPKVELPHSGFANHNKQTFKSKIMRFVRGNLLIPDARVSWVKSAYREAVRIIESENIDIFYISSPPHSSQLIGLKLKKRFPNKTWIADLRDPWTDIYFYKDMLHTLPAKKLDAAYERKVLQQADEILVANDGIKKIFLKKNVAPDEKIHVIPNGFDEADFGQPTHAQQDAFLITHTGTMAESYRPEVFFSVLKKIVEKHGNNIPIQGLFVGQVSESIPAMAEKYGLSNHVEFKGYVPHAEIIKFQKNATCLLIAIPNTDNESNILPGKIFEYLAAKKPILGIGTPDGDAGKIIAECEAGRMFNRDDEMGMFAFLEEKIAQWKISRNIDIVSAKADKYSRRNLTGKLSQIIHRKN